MIYIIVFLCILLAYIYRQKQQLETLISATMQAVINGTYEIVETEDGYNLVIDNTEEE